MLPLGPNLLILGVLVFIVLWWYFYDDFPPDVDA